MAERAGDNRRKQPLIQEGDILAIVLDKGFTWLDAGAPDSMSEATGYVKTIGKYQRVQIGCPGEMAIKNG